jgi:hypothetical protein
MKKYKPIFKEAELWTSEILKNIVNDSLIKANKAREDYVKKYLHLQF